MNDAVLWDAFFDELEKVAVAPGSLRGIMSIRGPIGEALRRNLGVVGKPNLRTLLSSRGAIRRMEKTPGLAEYLEGPKPSTVALGKRLTPAPIAKPVRIHRPNWSLSVEQLKAR